MVKPSVGRIVHVPAEAPPCRAAIVTAVWPDRNTIDVEVFPPAGVDPYPLTDIHEGGERGWHWPERED
jgi:hypothetical protein